MTLLEALAALAGYDEAGGGKGYRAVDHAGAHGHRDVPHCHLHLLGGRPPGPLLVR
ncbi:MAG: HIT domain-containing protein [Paracoccaceae bacterium]